MHSYYNSNYCYYNINISLILSCSSNIVYVWVSLDWKMDWSGRMDYRMENGMYCWWHHCVLDSFIPIAFRSQENPFITGKATTS